MNIDSTNGEMAAYVIAEVNATMLASLNLCVRFIPFGDSMKLLNPLTNLDNLDGFWTVSSNLVCAGIISAGEFSISERASSWLASGSLGCCVLFLPIGLSRLFTSYPSSSISLITSYSFVLLIENSLASFFADTPFALYASNNFCFLLSVIKRASLICCLET